MAGLFLQRQFQFLVVLCWIWIGMVHIAQSQSVNNNNETSTVITPPVSCFTTFTELNAAIAAKDAFDPKTFYVCPNTIITVGIELTGSTGEYVGGEKPLGMRQFTKVYCGEDGSSKNNCTVRGGRTQIRVINLDYVDEDKKRMVIKGFTFENSAQASLLTVYSAGDLLVEDCIYRNRVDGGILSASVSFNIGPEITFHNCTFESNALSRTVTTPFFDLEGLTKLTITDSVFFNNSFSPDTSRATYAIRAGDPTTTISLSGNCFFGNDFNVLGIVYVTSAESILSSTTKNFGAKDDPDLQCQFINIEGRPCIDFDLDECPIPGVVVAVPAGTKPSAGRMAVLTPTTVLGLVLVWNIGLGGG